jgi:hypothetical protein
VDVGGLPEGGVTVSDKAHAQQPPKDSAPEFTEDHIRALLRNADRLSFGVRPDGFVLINRARFLTDHGITQSNAQLVDQWVTDAGGGVQPLRRAAPQTRAERKQSERTKRRETIVWGIPGAALK